MESSNPVQICRLCLQTSGEVVDIWQTFQDSAIATILVKHFWFLQVNKNDGLTDWLCQICWVQTKTFHEFYVKVEQFQKCYWDAIKNDGGDNDGNVVEPDLTIIKCEETELTSQAIDSQITEEDAFEYSDDSDAGPQNSNDNSAPSDKTLQADDNRKVSTPVSRSDRLKNQAIRREQTRELNGQLREWFTMKCDICIDGEFETWLDVKRHYRNVHQMVGYLACCDRKFRLRGELLDHIRHHIVNPESAKLNTQIREWFTMKCDICPDDVAFKTLLDVRRHYREVHKMRGYLTCCNKKFHKRHSMVTHVRGHTNPDAFRCEQCAKSFTTNHSLETHIAQHVSLDSRAFKCNLCSSSFGRMGILNAHIRSKHTPKNGEKFPCEICNKSYRSELSLKHHIRNSHNTLHNYVCEACARQFKTRQLLRNHVTNEHSTTAQPKVQCDICGSWLKSKKYIIRHIKVQHVDVKPANCLICEKVFRNQHRLRQHIRSVHGERKHECVLCDKAFKNATNLKEHVAIHTGEDLYKCQYCDRKFKSNANLCSHRKKAHSAEWSRLSKVKNKRESCSKSVKNYRINSTKAE